MKNKVKTFVKKTTLNYEKMFLFKFVKLFVKPVRNG